MDVTIVLIALAIAILLKKLAEFVNEKLIPGISLRRKLRAVKKILQENNGIPSNLKNRALDDIDKLLKSKPWVKDDEEE